MAELHRIEITSGIDEDGNAYVNVESDDDLGWYDAMDMIACAHDNLRVRFDPYRDED